MTFSFLWKVLRFDTKCVGMQKYYMGFLWMVRGCRFILIEDIFYKENVPVYYLYNKNLINNQ